ncbi:MAG TPA: hypothetical protein VHW66_00285 [Stellaceae bacterium]|jgi:hypothetical protein|nr:hypothetical protein [Stellaceae bacterium]
MSGSGYEAGSLEQSLRRLGELTAALDGIGNEAAREAAGELLRLVLDLHGLALARMVATVAAAADGRALVGALAADPSIRAALLLHGLHPETAAERLRAAIERMRPAWGERGFRVELVTVQGAAARLRIHNDGGGEPAYLFQQDAEQVLVEAAPDLDNLVFEVDGSARQAA